MRSLLLPMLSAAFLWPVVAGAQLPAPGGQHPPALTLEAALRSALQHPEGAAARLESDAAQAALTQARVRPNPVLSLEHVGARAGTGGESTVQVTQPLDLGGKRAARVRAAEAGLVVARQRQAAKDLELRNRVVQAFADSAVAQESVALTEASVRLASQAADIAARRVAAGKVSPVEETRANVARANAQVELLRAQGQFRAELAGLNLLAGTQAETLSTNGAVLPQAPAAQLLQQWLDDAPEVRIAQAEARRLAALADLERSRRTPDVDISLGMKRSADGGRTQALVGVAIPLPLFDRNQGAILEARRRYEQAEELARATRLRVATTATRALEELRSAVEQVHALDKGVLSGARSAYEAATRGFELGKFTFTDVLDAQRAYLQAQAQRMQAVSQAYRAHAAFQSALGLQAPSIP